MSRRSAPLGGASLEALCAIKGHLWVPSDRHQPTLPSFAGTLLCGPGQVPPVLAAGVSCRGSLIGPL